MSRPQFETVVDTDDTGKTVHVSVEILTRIEFVIEDGAWSLPRSTVLKMPAGSPAKAYYDEERTQRMSAKFPALGPTIAPHFYGQIVITKHAMRPYVRFGTEGFFKRLDGEGPLRLEIVATRRSTEG